MDPTPANLKDFNDKAYFKPRAIPESVWPQAAILIRERHSREMVLSLREDDFLEKPLGRLRTPTQILWGEADRAIPPSQGQAFRSLIRGSSLHILKRCGHLPQKECPEKVRRAVFGSL
jgi:pimeloyl-ACP methyl ester carboxylesterase